MSNSPIDIEKIWNKVKFLRERCYMPDLTDTELFDKLYTKERQEHEDRIKKNNPIQ